MGVAKARIPRSRRIKWIVCLLSISGTLVAAEVVLRVVAKATSKVRGATYDSELGWRLMPNICKYDSQWCRDAPARTNSYGWRDREHAIQKRPGTTRIVMLGDSFTFGFGVDYGERVSEALENLIPNSEVLNMGVFAYGPDQEVLTYELHARQFQPDVVLLNVFLGNDLNDLRLKKCYSFPKPYFKLSGDELELVKPQRNWLLFARTSSYLGELAARVKDRGVLKSEVAEELRDVDVVPLFLAIVDRLSVATTADHCTLLVVLIYPRDATNEVKLDYDRLRHALSGRQYGVLDLKTLFEEEAARGSELYLSEGHWNPAGHKLAAQAIRAKLTGGSQHLPMLQRRGNISPLEDNHGRQKSDRAPEQ
jgi:hypothetical protein